MHHGESGYVKNTKTIIDITRKIADGIKRIPGLKLVCTPEVSVVAWTSDVFDINRMSLNLIDKKGWDLNVLQFPSSIHIAITMAHSNEVCYVAVVCPGAASHYAVYGRGTFQDRMFQTSIL